MEIFVTLVTHQHGTNLYANTSMEGARKALVAYCKEYWSDRMDQDLPEDPSLLEDQAIIDGYFNDREYEWGEITPVVLGV